MIQLNFILSLILLSSCSAVRFSSSNRLPVTMNYSQEDASEVTVDVSRPFYLWGMMPEIQVIDIDKEFAQKGFKSVSDLRIVEVDTNTKFLWMLFTFGMYYPQSFNLIASVN